MKRVVHLIGILLFSLNLAQAQEATKFNFSLARQLKNARVADREIALFVQGDAAVVRAKTEALGGIYKYAAGDIHAIRLPLRAIGELAACAEIRRIESNDLQLEPLNDRMVELNHVSEVHLGFNLPQGYQGDGVIMGIIDEGIDYTHPDFRDLSGRTRIAFLWDQAVINFDPGTQAQPYGYGKEYTGSQIDTSTQHYDSPTSHGTHVAGIACGNGRALNNYKGVAPNADMIVVKMNLNRPDNEFLSSLVDAVKYIFDKADSLGKPAVINISLGTYFGSHDGRDIQALAIDNLISSRPGHVVVCSAGNAGNAPIHLGYEANADTQFTWLQPGAQSIHLQAWGDSGVFGNIRFAVGIDRISPTRQSLATLPFRPGDLDPGVLKTDTLFDQYGNQLGLIESMVQYWNGNYGLDYRIYPDSTVSINGSDTVRYFWRFASTGQGRFDAWSYDMVFDNLPDSVTYPLVRYYRKPDTDQTLVSSFTCSDKVITVGSYVNRNYYTNANFATTIDTSLTVGRLSSFSSKGPTRDGRIKPDITATGEWVLSCGSQAELNQLVAVEPDKVAAGRKHKRSSGTSMSSPVVAGIAALYLQKNPSADWQEVKNVLLRCAEQDQFTGNSLPNTSWGYGKADAYAVVRGCTVGIEESGDTPYIDFGLFPNPAVTSTTFHFDLSLLRDAKDIRIRILDAAGRSLKTLYPNRNAGTLEAELNDLAPGIYSASLESNQRFLRTLRFAVVR
jgi:subtilisin family serine protease